MLRSSFWWVLGAGLFASTAFAQDADDAGESAPERTDASLVEEPAAGPDPRDERLRALEARLSQLEADQSADEEAPAASPVAPSSRHTPEPWAWGDFSWAPGNYGPIHPALSHTDGELSIQGEIRMDAAYHYSLANPIDDTISGSSEVFRHGELQLAQIGVGGNLSYGNVHARFMTQYGMYSQTTPRNDASPGRGQWNLDDAYRYISEAYGGVHIDELRGINIQAGIFMSYVGLWAYYNFDNWTYQPSYVSSNTPWFFNGIRAQIQVNDNLKIEPWLINGWQAYGRFNEAPGVGLQILWRPFEWFSFVSNNYGGTDTLGNLSRGRLHTDNSIMIRYHDDPTSLLNRAAFSVTIDAGCEFGGTGTDSMGNTVGVSCTNQYFLGFMAYHRMWFDQGHVGFTVGGGAITNPGRYLVLIPPINGATAYSGTPYFTANPGDPYQAWDMQLTLDWMPFEYITFRGEFNHRAASVPYFSGHGGVTPPGGNSGGLGSMVMGWAPDLAYTEDRFTVAFLVRL